MLVVDDVTTFGKGVADNFQKKFKELGGKVSRDGAAKDTTRLQLDHHQPPRPATPDGVYYGGVVRDRRCGLLLKQLRQAGLEDPVHRS